VEAGHPRIIHVFMREILGWHWAHPLHQSMNPRLADDLQRIRIAQSLHQLQALFGLTIAASSQAPAAVAQHSLQAQCPTPGGQCVEADVHSAAWLHLGAQQPHDAPLHGWWHPAP